MSPIKYEDEHEPEAPLNFTERMALKRKQEQQDEAERIEKERIAYLRRTGRKEMKP